MTRIATGAVQRLIDASEVNYERRTPADLLGEPAWAETRGGVVGYWSDEHDPDPEPDEYRCSACGEELSGWEAVCDCSGARATRN